MTSEAPSQSPNRIWRELLRLQYNKVIKSLRHEPNQIDIIWLGELVKRLGNSPHLRRRGPLNRLYLGAMTSEAVS